MRSRLTRVITALVAILFGALLPAPALATVSEDATYTYDFHDLSAPTPHSTTERGPPATHNAITYDPNGLRTLGVSARSHTPTTPATYDYDDLARFVRTAHGSHGAEGQPRGIDGDLCALLSVRSAANGGSRIAANQAAGNAARDALSATHPGSLIEQSFRTTAGVRRLDILTQGGLGIESKVGRTSLTAFTRSQIAKDSLLLRNGDVTGIEWVFSRSGVTGQIGPTRPLADALGKAGIPWRLGP